MAKVKSVPVAEVVAPVAVPAVESVSDAVKRMCAELSGIKSEIAALDAKKRELEGSMSVVAGNLIPHYATIDSLNVPDDETVQELVASFSKAMADGLGMLGAMAIKMVGFEAFAMSAPASELAQDAVQALKDARPGLVASRLVPGAAGYADPSTVGRALVEFVRQRTNGDAMLGAAADRAYASLFGKSKKSSTKSSSDDESVPRHVFGEKVFKADESDTVGILYKIVRAKTKDSGWSCSPQGKAINSYFNARGIPSDEAKKEIREKLDAQAFPWAKEIMKGVDVSQY